MMLKTLVVRIVFSLTISVAFSQALYAGDDFKPIPAEERTLKSEPNAPGAHAIILLWTDDQDDTESHEVEYVRLKIFTEEGKKYADIEIPYLQDVTAISDIKARTVHSDGTVVPFTGKPFDKLVVKTRDIKFYAKTFTLPDVQPGSIIEYRYKVSWASGPLARHIGYSLSSSSGGGSPSRLFNTRWILQRNLFIKKAVLTMKPYTSGRFTTYWLTVGLPPGKNLVGKGRNAYELTLEDVAPFDEESNAPPELDLKPRIEFFYSALDVEPVERFWKRIGKERWDYTEKFIGTRSSIHDAAIQAVGQADSVETKLRKLYARAQQIRNLSYERRKTDQEQKRDNLRDNQSAEDVMKNGYGYHNEINRLFVAMARSIGLDAGLVEASRRDESTFLMNLLDEMQVTHDVVIVRAENKKWYLDPGVAMCPFGLIRWEYTGVQSIELNKDGGIFISTPDPQSKNAILRRAAHLKYEDGVYKGTIKVDYLDQIALGWRLYALNSDAAEQKKEMEDEAKGWFPSGSTVKLTQIMNAKNQDEPLSVEFEVELAGIGSNVGSRTLLPISVFQSNNKNPFQHEKRVQPVSFNYPFQELDEVSVEVPAGLNVENLPPNHKQQTDFGFYESAWQQAGNTISVKRRFAILRMYSDVEDYPGLRAFYEKVNTSDKESVMLRAQAK